MRTPGGLHPRLPLPLARQEEEAPVQVEYVSTHDEMAADPAFADFSGVFERFQSAEALLNPVAEASTTEAKAKPAAAADADAEGEGEAGEEKMSRKKSRKLKRLSVAELKQLVARPEVVEQWDVTAADPRLLVMLKSYRNCVPVPKHWCQKRHFLQGKRGVEKPPFKLPEFIEATGIAKIRAAVMERESGKKLKAKQKERVQPKMGKIDIDYQVLHDAFFKYQTKPVLTGHGDVYYEGKEFEVAPPALTLTLTLIRAPHSSAPHPIPHRILSLTLALTLILTRWRCVRRSRATCPRSCARRWGWARTSRLRG